MNSEGMPRLFVWLYHRLAPGWQTWLLAAGLLTIAMVSVQGAQWVPDSTPINVVLYLGALCGAMLAAAPWPGWVSLAYTLLIGPVLTVQEVGQVLPPLSVAFSLPALKLVELMNVRLFALFDRMSGWLTLYQSGKPIPDTGLFVGLFCLVAWLVGAWLSWCMRRWQMALAGMLPLGLLLAINLNLSGQETTALWLFIIVGLLLVARAAHNRQHADWEHRLVDYPDDIGVDWSWPAFGLAVIIALAAWAAPLLGTPRGWQALSDLFKPAQQQVADTAGRIFAQVNPPKTTPIPVVHADTPQLGVVGAPPAQGHDVVFWVGTSDPPPPPPEAGANSYLSVPQHYWRSEVFATYTGRGWEAAAEDAAPFNPATASRASGAPPFSPTAGPAPSFLPEAAQGHYPLTQSFEIPSEHGAQLFAASQPVEVSAASSPGQAGPAVVLHRTRPDGSLLVYGSPGTIPASYTVTSFVPNPTTAELEAAGTDYPPEIRAAYLQLPSELPERVRNLARRLGASAANPYQAALSIQDYLRLTYTYDLAVKPPVPGQDVVDYFLFEARAGFCSYYASAMAVLLRSQGIPARVASGFANGGYNYDKAAYMVTTGDAHAWVEVYFPGLGWVEFEPTVNRTPFTYASGGAPLAPEAPAPKPFSLPPAVTLGLFVLVMAGAIGLLALLLRFLGRGPRMAGGPGPAALAQAHYFTVRRALGLAGLSAPNSATPAEFLEGAAPALERSQRKTLAAALAQATDLYQQAAFSAHPPAASAVEAARRTWNGAFGQWLRLAVSKRLNRGRNG